MPIRRLCGSSNIPSKDRGSRHSTCSDISAYQHPDQEPTRGCSARWSSPATTATAACHAPVASAPDSATRPAGHCANALDQITRETSPLDARAPAAVERWARWVDPVFVADVEYREMTAEGILRHPSFRGIRTDRSPEDVGWPG
ncbi:hypothetical protein IU450_38130 [Nocardia abscessus]|uniref:ATP dependent DNA ligase n=1 Tax=Nocardia TaxID=1817 RepID=UPI001893C2A4|nr:hypothetical protein [Nocardia abscessus]